MSSREPAPQIGPPHRALPLLHAAFALAFAGLSLAPLVTADGRAPTLIEITGGWALATLALLGITAAAAVGLSAANRVTWGRLLLVNMLSLVALVPAALGGLVAYQAGRVEGAGGEWGFWGIVALLILRLPLSALIRRNAAREHGAV